MFCDICVDVGSLLTDFDICVKFDWVFRFAFFFIFRYYTILKYSLQLYLSKVPNRTLGQKVQRKGKLTINHLSWHAQTFPPGYLPLVSDVLPGNLSKAVGAT